jgi:hypothetical protein
MDRFSTTREIVNAMPDRIRWNEEKQDFVDEIEQKSLDNDANKKQAVVEIELSAIRAYKAKLKYELELELLKSQDALEEEQ